MTTKAIAMRRVSTKDQAENNHSLAQQNSSVQNMASVLNAHIVQDWGMAISSKKGKNLKRKDLQEALNYCRYNRGVKYLLIDKVSRFMRELKMIFYYMVEFEQLGVKVVFCDPSQQRYNADTAEAMYELARKAYEAEAENEERSQTSITKMQERVRLGYYPFYPHQGYMKTDAADGLHVPDVTRFGLLQKALKATASLEMEPKEAQLWLVANGYRTPAIYRKDENGIRQPKGGRPIDLGHFTDIMKDPYYAGVLKVGDWPENDNPLHQPMITKEEYETNLAIATGRKIRRKRKYNPDFPLNLAMHDTCSGHDGKLTGILHSNGKGWRRKEYVCRHCKKRVPQELVHQSFQDILDRLYPAEDGPEALTTALTEVWNKNQAYRIDLVKRLEQQLDSLNGKKSELIATLAANPDLADDIRAEIVSNKARAVEIERQLADANDVSEEFKEFMLYALSYVEDLRHKFWTLPGESMVQCKQLLFNDVISVAQDGKVYTPQISPIYTLLKANSGPKTAKNANMVELAGTAPASAGLPWLVFYRLSSL